MTAHVIPSTASSSNRARPNRLTNSVSPLGLKPAPEFEDWLARMGMLDAGTRLERADPRHPLLALAGD